MTKSDEAKQAKRHELYAKVIQASYDAAMNTKLPMGLRRYYAGVALFYDNKLRRETA
jgi:hypothetical protein